MRGHEFVVGGLDGSAGESLSVNLTTGQWADFATDEKGGDLISLYAAVKRISQVDAARALDDALPAVPTQERADDWTVITPVPPHAGPPPAAHFRHGRPVHTARYLDRDGNLLGLIYRCEPAGGKKEVVPLSWCRRIDGREEWRWKSQAKPRSLYGAELLSRDARVLVVEGEPKCDAARRMLGDDVTVIAWPGGAQAVQHADWSMLAGRDVVIWPDADTAGVTAAAAITIQLRHHGATARIVALPDDLPKGWDLADAEREGWSGDAVMRVVDPPAPEPEPEYYDDYESEQAVDFMPLGHDRGRFYFFTSGGGQVRDFSARDLQVVGCLLELAPLRFWEMNYPGKGDAGFNSRSAGDALVRVCYKVGIYDAGRLRGRGAWLDDSRSVLHLGDRCILDGVESGLVIQKSHFIYEHSQRLNADLGEPLSNAEANRLRELCIMCPWESPAHMGNLLAGWCVIAPVCGAMPWRPHLWVTSEGGGGKSWVLDKIIKIAIGPIALTVQSKTTEAGIRQTLGCDARPVIFDEAEGQNERDRDRVQHVLDLARQASSEDGAAIIKGSTNGKATQFHIRSCFAFSSINVGVTQAADESRTVVLTLRLEPDITKRASDFAALKAMQAEVMVPGYSGRLLARTLSLLPVIRTNAVVFAEAIARSGKPKRLGDTYGVLMAGAWSLRSRAVATAAEADKMVADTQWVKDAVVKTEVEPEWSRALSTMLQHRVRVTHQGRSADIPVGELVMSATGRVDHGSIGEEDAARELNRMGMRVHGAFLQIGNNSQGCGDIFARTPWASSWSSTMLRAPGSAKNVATARLAGHLTKAFGLPLREIIGN